MVAAWMLMALAFSIDAPVVRKSAALAVGVVSASAILLAAVGGARRTRDASLRTFGQAYRSVLSQPWFALVSTLLAAGATALFAWQLATLNRVRFDAPSGRGADSGRQAWEAAVRRRSFDGSPNGHSSEDRDSVHRVSTTERTCRPNRGVRSLRRTATVVTRRPQGHYHSEAGAIRHHA